VSEISRAALFGKLNPLAYRAIEGATTFCKLRGNPYVELVHWVHQILQTPGSDLHEIIKHFELDPGRVAGDVVAALDRLPRGASSISDLSEHIADAVERGWVYGTLMFNQSQVRTGFLIIGMLKTQSLMNILFGISAEFRKLKIDPLTDHFAKIVAASPEENLQSKDGRVVGGGAVPGEASGAMAPAQMGKQEALARYTVDLTERAEQGKIDPIVGRDVQLTLTPPLLAR
jgi:type VI secretion system protein VasG